MSEIDYKNLQIWQKAMDLCTDIYQMTESFPSKEQFGITSQMRRCAVSIPSNIAEGRNRSTKKDFKQFLHIAKGSAAELATQLEICRRIGYLKFDEVDRLMARTDEILRMIGSLIGSLRF